MKKSFRESAYDTESDEDQPKMFKKQQEVTVKGPNIDVAKALLSQLKLQTVTHSRKKVSEHINEEEILRRLLARVHKLDCGHISALSECYLAHHFAMIGDADVLKELMSKQARATTTIMNCVDTKFQKELPVPQSDGTTGAANMTSLQGSLFVKHLLMTFFGRDRSALKDQEVRIQQVFDSYPPVGDLYQFIETVRTEQGIYNKLVVFYTKPQDRPKTEYDLMKDLLQVVYKVPTDQDVSRELLQQVEDSKATLETVLQRLQKNRKLNETLDSKSAAVKSESGKSADKKSVKQQQTANPAIQNRAKCPTCGLDHDISACPKEQEKQRQAALKRGNLLPSNVKSNKQGGNSNTSQSGSVKQPDICSMCLARGKSYFHSPTQCWNKATFIRQMSDPNQQEKLLKRYADRSKSLSEQQNGAVSDKNAEAPQGAQSPSTEKQQFVPQDHQYQQGSRSYDLPRFPVQAMTTLPQPSELSGPPTWTSQFLLPWQLSGQFGTSSVQGDMHTSGVLRPGVFQPSQGPRSACVSQQLERAPERHFLESYPMTMVHLQQPGYVQSAMQRQDVPRAADNFQGNIQQQTDERFSSGPDRASAQAATS